MTSNNACDFYFIYSDENEAALKRVIDFCRGYGVTPMGVQLAHAGRKGSTQLPLDGGKPLTAGESSWTTLAPSAISFGAAWPENKPLGSGGVHGVCRGIKIFGM